MAKKLQLTIPKPCHENWDDMTPVEKGKFCGSCQKQVVDFSNMSDRQVAEFFKKPSTGSVCGRFMTDQLDRSIEIPKKRIPWLKYFFQFALPAFLVSIKASAQKTQGKIIVNKVVKDAASRPIEVQVITTGGVMRRVYNQPLKGDVSVTPVKNNVVENKVKADTVLLPDVVIFCNSVLRMGKVLDYQVVNVETSIIKGKVINEKGNPIPDATVLVKGTSAGVVTNEKGSFSITQFAGWNNISLIGSCVGFEPTGLLIDKKNLSDSVIIQLRPVISRFLTGELVVCRKPPTKKEIEKVPLLPAITDDKPAAAFSVFPNPVESGSSLNIEIQKVEEGYYGLQLLNLSGQSLHQQEIWIDEEARLLNIDVPAVAAGTYFLVLTSKRSAKRFTEKIIIQ
jgi:hypothetical protein